MPAPELGPLIWLATQPGCPLRLGVGKPLGFGAVTVTVNWKATELCTADSLAAFRVVASGLEEPAAYPRIRPQPEAETYR